MEVRAELKDAEVRQAIEEYLERHYNARVGSGYFNSVVFRVTSPEGQPVQLVAEFRGDLKRID